MAEKSQVIYKNYSVSFLSSAITDTQFSINIAQSGYTAISYSIICGYSTNADLLYGVESFSDSLIKGFYKNGTGTNITATFKVVYYKN